MITIKSDTDSITLIGCSIDKATVQAMSLIYMLARTIDEPVMIDAGAHVGEFTVLAGLVPEMTVHAFEPNTQVLPLLADNMFRNELEDQIFVHGYALLDRTGSAMLSRPHRRSRRALATLADINFRKGTKRRVATCQIDDLFDIEATNFWIHREIDILKLDVEGAELMVLRGGERTIKRCRPAILAETQGKRTRQFGYDIRAIFLLLEEWGYESQEVTKRDTFFWHRPEHDPNLWFNDREHKTCLRFTPS